MSYNASSQIVSTIIKLSGEIVIGLGTSLTYNEPSRELYGSLETAIEEFEVGDVEASGRFERALIKAASRALLNYQMLAIAGGIQVGENLADYKDELNFNALKKAVLAFSTEGDAGPVINHLLPTVYLWQERLPEGTPTPSGEPEDRLYFRVAVFNEGRPMESADSKLCRAHYKTREWALDAVNADNFGGVFCEGGAGEPYQVVEQEAPKPYLYILMRNDLASLNAGKAVAQGTHAANQMVAELRRRQLHSSMTPAASSVHAALNIWEKEANGFGTCIVLAVNEKQMRSSVAKALDDALPSHAGICHDPSYPLMDGKTLHLLPVDTCAYVFDYPARAKRHLVGYPLMP